VLVTPGDGPVGAVVGELELEPEVVVVAAVFGVEDEQALATRAISATATTIQVHLRPGPVACALPVAIDRLRPIEPTTSPPVPPVVFFLTVRQFGTWSHERHGPVRSRTPAPATCSDRS
jgi:hypothetical protein